MNIYIGIDPGLDGAIAFLRPKPTGGVSIEIRDMPTVKIERGGKERRDYYPLEIWKMTCVREDSHAVIERPQSMPRRSSGQRIAHGGMADFSLGQCLGIFRGLLTARGIAYTLVPPATWKREMRIGKGKDASIVRALEVFPQAAEWITLKKHHGRAEALLLAAWGLRQRLPVS